VVKRISGSRLQSVPWFVRDRPPATVLPREFGVLQIVNHSGTRVETC
jgi:hypothetical protein